MPSPQSLHQTKMPRSAKDVLLARGLLTRREQANAPATNNALSDSFLELLSHNRGKLDPAATDPKGIKAGQVFMLTAKGISTGTSRRGSPYTKIYGAKLDFDFPTGTGDITAMANGALYMPTPGQAKANGPCGGGGNSSVSGSEFGSASGSGSGSGSDVAPAPAVECDVKRYGATRALVPRTTSTPPCSVPRTTRQVITILCILCISPHTPPHTLHTHAHTHLGALPCFTVIGIPLISRR